MIKIKRGDVLKAFEAGEIDILAHGVNCSGGFGSGIAGQIAKRYPGVAKAYFSKYEHGLTVYTLNGWHLGDIQVITLPGKRNIERNFVPAKYIVNCATQKNYGSDGRKYVDYKAIESCMLQVLALAKREHEYNDIHPLRIGIPRIGAGLGGGNWEVIENILLDVFTEIDINVFMYYKE